MYILYSANIPVNIDEMFTDWRYNNHMNNRLPNRHLLIVAYILVIAMALLLQPATIFAAGNSESKSKSDIEMTNSAGGVNTDIEVDPVGKTEGYSAVLYDNTSGLPTSEANAIAETSEGFIWIGSYSGLIRYDGNTFERIDSTTGIASVVCLYVDSKDRLWVGTNDNGVALMQNGEFRMIGKADGLGSDSVRGIVEDEQGRLYVATTSGIVIIDEDLNIIPIDDERINGAYMRSIRLGNDGYLYCLTQGGDLFTIKDAGVSSYISSDKIGIDGLMAILPDPEKPGCVYLGTEGSNIYYGMDPGFAFRGSTADGKLLERPAVTAHGMPLEMGKDDHGIILCQIFSHKVLFQDLSVRYWENKVRAFRIHQVHFEVTCPAMTCQKLDVLVCIVSVAVIRCIACDYCCAKCIDYWLPEAGLQIILITFLTAMHLGCHPAGEFPVQQPEHFKYLFRSNGLCKINL